jgi:hypothetical protein
MLASKTEAGARTPEARRFFEAFKVIKVDQKGAGNTKK